MTTIKPPFTEDTARAKVKAAEDAWNTRNPEKVALAYTEDSPRATAMSFLLDERQLSNFCTVNGRRN